MTSCLALTNIRELTSTVQKTEEIVPKGYIRLRVLYCAICRTDAKMWDQGHRDLVLPRVPGHEILAVCETTAKHYVIWPGQACGQCSYCLQGRDNLCDRMKIIGFHSHGGFASHVTVPLASLIPVEPPEDNAHTLCFAEPLACVLNALAAASLKSREGIIVYGGGVVGLLAALACTQAGAKVVVVEQSEEKILKGQRLCAEAGIELCKDTGQGDFDVAINCCDSPAAWSLCATKLKKTGRLCFFSGLEKNELMDTNLLNLIHYKEIEVFGTYGPRKEHMIEAARLCQQYPYLDELVEQIVLPDQVAALMEQVLSGTDYKYIIDFNAQVPVIAASQRKKEEKDQQQKKHTPALPQQLATLIHAITPPTVKLRAAAERKIDLKTKPLGALGKIEHLAVKTALIRNSLSPKVDKKRLFVFAGDHGIVEEGVSAYPSRVTAQMVNNFLEGGAAINVFCAQFNIELLIIDMGVNHTFSPHPQLISKKVRKGSRNFALQRAMTLEETHTAIELGAQAFREQNKASSCELVGLGEMGIGNTSAASAIISCVTGIPVAEIVGRGTGIDDKGLQRKIEILEKALTFHQPLGNDPIDILSRVGGYEIAGICGAVLAAAADRTCIVLDGLISTAGGLLAYLLCPDVADYIIAGHKSVETGQKSALEFIGLEPVLDLDMRLGEGTGAAITMNLVELACRVMRDMASFEDAGIDRKI